MSNGKKYKIGQMAKLCNLTTKQLRHYDEDKILSPAYKDEETNYRYYTEEQIEEILLIKELRQIGLSLKSIAALLGKRDLPSLKRELRESIQQAKVELHEAQQKYERTIDVFLRVAGALDWLNEAPEEVESGVASFQLVDVPVRPVVYTRYRCYWNAKKLFIGRRAELYKIAEEHKLATEGPNMALFHSDYMKQFSDDPDDSEGDLEICMNVKEPKTRCANCRHLGGWKAVSGIHIGHYRHMKPTYTALERFAEQRGLALSGAALEEYIAGATMTSNEENYVTRIYLPLAGSVL
ncbi:MerR family transcriptional regulator [Synergistaceae bacterium OttesenSCG-928-I11]|nr:MerR family transcriptional regulator [Synergistaceae bacterium OttesenSCG-928-I11]